MSDSKRYLPVVDDDGESVGPSSLRKDGSRAFVYPADVRGRFATARRVVFVLLMAVYVALPWIHIGGRPAVFLDIEHREFDLFGMTFNAQDSALVFFLLTGAAFSLVALTALAGRVWCGWACPQTVFLDGIYRRIERLIEGGREARMRRDAGPWTFTKVALKTLKHVLYVIASLLLTHVFISYFVSVPRLYESVRHSPAAHPVTFAWTFGLAALFYLNFGHFREQFCIAMCPYGRLQGALTDAHSLTVGYDTRRGEPRGKAHAQDRGACVDCNRCVVVCPTGIDIRRGHQLDCVGCTACIDACDAIMDKLGQPRGLIRYDSQEGLEGRARKVMRPRLVIYAVLGLLGLSVATFVLRGRTDFEANLLRQQGAPYVLDGDEVRNAFQIHLVNKRGTTATLLIEPAAPAGVRVVAPLRAVTLGPLENASAPVFISVDRAAFRGDFRVPITVRVQGSAERPRVLQAPVLGPAR